MTGEMIVKRMQENKKITQMDYNRVIIAALEKIDNPSMADIREHVNNIFGGICFYCGEPWKKIINKSAFLNFTHYEPVCECIENEKKKEKCNEMESRVVENCNIPIKYINATIRGMDRNVKKETIEAIDKVKGYVKFKLYNITGLLLFGDVGTGKTHLSVAVLKAIVIKEGKTGWFVNTSSFFNEVYYAKKNLIKEIISHEVVVLDDIDKAFTGKDKDEQTWRKEQFFNLIDGLVNMKRIIIMTSNIKSIKDLSAHYDDYIVSRIMRACDKYIAVRGDDYQLRRKGII